LTGRAREKSANHRTDLDAKDICPFLRQRSAGGAFTKCVFGVT